MNWAWQGRFDLLFVVVAVPLIATCHRRIWIICFSRFQHLWKGLLSGCYWVQDSSNTVFFPKVAFISWGLLHIFEYYFEGYWSLCWCYTFCKEHHSHDVEQMLLCYDTTCLNSAFVEQIYDMIYKYCIYIYIHSSAVHFRGMFHHVSVLSQEPWKFRCLQSTLLHEDISFKNESFWNTTLYNYMYYFAGMRYSSQWKIAKSGVTLQTILFRMLLQRVQALFNQD